MVEGEQARVREEDIFPALRRWAKKGATRFLEVGCGQGACAAALARSHYVGIDPSSTFIHRARERYGDRGWRFEIGRAEALPLGDGEVNGVFSVAVLHLLPDLKRAFKEMARVLEREGHLFALTAHPDNYPHWTSRYPKGEPRGMRFHGKVSFPDGGWAEEVLCLHSMETLLTGLSLAGLELETARGLRPVAGGKFQYLQIEAKRA